MNSPEYSLVSEEWIPCRFMNGKVLKLGLKEVLFQAHDIAEIYDASPLVTTALIRLMLALLYRCYPAVTDVEFDANWKRLWYASKLPNAEIETYLGEWQERFYLFHDKYPFYQTAGMSVVKESTKGAIEEDPDNVFRMHKDTPDVAVSHLFDHRHLYESQVDIPVDEAARLLIATQNYGTSSSQSGRYMLGGEAKFDPGGRQNGLLFKGIVCWLTGRTLKETLLLNWVHYIARENDYPCWESEDYTNQITSSQKKGNARVPAGPLEIYTWQARMVRLLLIERQGSFRVAQVHFTQGRQAQKATIRDPMKFYLRGSNGEDESVLCMTEEKASWRDVHALLQFKHLKQNDTRPPVLLHIAERLDKGDVTRNDLPPLILNVSGFVNTQAKLILWRHDRLPLPVAYLEDADLISRLASLLAEAEKVEEALQTATKALCRNFLAPGLNDAYGNRIKEAKEPHPSQVTNLKACLNPASAYWKMLETDFNILLFSLTGADKEEASENWKDAIQERAKQAFAEAIIRLGNTPQVYKAGILARPDFRTPSRKNKIAKSPSKGTKSDASNE